MKILTLSDTHGEDDFSYLLDSARQADLIVVAGDISMFGMGIEEALEGLSKLQKNSNTPLVITHGNHEWGGLSQYMDDYPNLIYVDRNVELVEGVHVFGYGGGGFGQFDEEFEDFISTSYNNSNFGFVLWLLHGPPHDMVIDGRKDWGPTGCLSRSRMILKHKPQIVIAGHIHENAGIVVEHEGTILCNPGPSGLMLEVTLEDN